ncbi:lipopolysaccharide biosynthesis protein [Pedobacter paludis]|uniref:Polysaccharide biosynthesis protein n=1 Tax=Pedobacter paludis TaxID=2203212 RepID=A0A317F5A8_9SPHI|nr:oligosaccharide flippase family protein [Pedobacter paludis]PWS33762.1 polysaccharide biosynthesis protein [Pedobacter paludis]
MNIISKLKNVHFLSLLGTGGMSVLIFVFTAILYRSLSVKDIGIWFFFQTMLSFLDTFRQGFLTTAFIKFYSGTTEERGREVIGSTWFIASTITLIFIVANVPILFFLSRITDESLNYFLKYFSLNLLFSLPMIIAMCITQGELRFDRLLYIRVTQVMILILSLLGLIYFKANNLHNLMMANLASSLITSLLTIFMGWSGIKFFFAKSKSCIKELFDFGKYTVGTSISSNLFGVTDTFVINFMLGPSSLAIYNLGRRLMEVVEIPLRSFVATAMPSLSKAYNIGDRAQVIYIMKKYIGMITIVLIPISIIAYFFAGVAMSLIGGGQYKGTIAGLEAVNIFRICIAFSLFYPLDRFMAVTLDAIHKPQVNFVKIIVMLIVNFLSDIIGIYIFGNIYGVVVGTVFPILAAVIISNYVIQKDYHKFSIIDIYILGYKELTALISSTLKNFKKQQTL